MREFNSIQTAAKILCFEGYEILATEDGTGTARLLKTGEEITFIYNKVYGGEDETKNER